MTPDPTDVLERRMGRAITTFDGKIAELNITIANVAGTRMDALKLLAKVRAVHDAALSACAPVIQAYEKVDTQDAEDKLEQAEAARDKVKFQLIDATHDLDVAFPAPVPGGTGAATAPAAATDHTDAMAAVASAATAAANAAKAIADASTAAAPGIRHAKLADIQIMPFRGDRTQYPRFKQLFDANIGNRTDINNITKFSHLSSYLRGEALRLIGGYDITEDNYKNACDALDAEYGKKELIINDLLRQLLRMMERKPAVTETAYRDIYIEAVSHSRALKALGYEEKDLKVTLTTLLTEKMPDNMRMQWYREERKVSGTVELKHLTDYIDGELAARNRYKTAGHGHHQQQHQDKPPRDQDRGAKPRGTTSAFHTSSQLKVLPCIFCNSTEHRSGKCPKTLKQRKDSYILHERCLRCSKKGHLAKECDQVCKNCWDPHHIFLCPKMGEPLAAKSSGGSGAIKSVTIASGTGGSVGKKKTHAAVCPHPSTSNLVLQTFWITVSGPKGQRRFRVLLDGGAHLSYITKRAANELGLLPSGSEVHSVSVFGGAVEDKTMPKVSLKIRTHKTNDILLSCLQVNKICEPVPAISLGHWRDKLQQRRLTIADGVESKRNERWDGRIDLLIGTQDYYTIVTNKCFNLSENLMAVETAFGWILHGRLDQQPSSNPLLAIVAHEQEEEESTGVLLQRLFDLDAAHPLDRAGSEDPDPALTHFQQTMCRLDTGQYQLRLPFKYNRPLIPSNFEIAKKQVFNRINKLKSEGLLEKYDEQIQNYIRDGQVEIVPPEERDSLGYGEVHYLTHRGVVKPGKNTPLRVVFNASLGKPSLNDCLHTGKNRVPLMTDILMRLRLHRIIITGDYRKAFLHIKIAPQDRNHLRFLWGENLGANDWILQFLRWCVVVFGVTCSPSELEMVLTYHVQQFSHRFPRTVAMMLRNTFVDDVIGGGEKREEVEQFVHEANIIANDAKMTIQRWTTNDPHLQAKLDAEVAGVPSDPKSDVLKLYDSSLKVLGSVLNRANGEDVFTFQTSALEDFCDSLRHRTSLRTVLSITARVYDILGLITPVTISARILMRNIWKKKLNWDDELPNDLKLQFWSWVDELRHLTSVRVPRHYFGGEVRPKSCQLHVCSDSSKDAHGAVAYFRSEYPGGEVHIAFGGSKARVTPTAGNHSIARLELLGAVTAVKLALQIQRALDPELELEIFFWTDSMVVLYWINGEWILWKEWVANRSRFIQENSARSQWRHIAGVENPADICSRGMTPSKLVQSDCIWFSGPAFLKKPRDQWPRSSLNNNIMQRKDVANEAKRSTEVLVSTQRTPMATIFNIKRFGTLEGAVRCTAQIQRLFANAIAIGHDYPTRKGELTSNDLDLARHYWYRQLQGEAFAEEMEALEHRKPVSRSSHIAIFRPYLTEDGLIRLHARTRLSSDLVATPDVPILPCKLPGEKGIPHFIILLIRQCHRRVCHAGAGSTLGEVRRYCWLIHGRQTVMKVLKNCVICNRHQSRGYLQPTAPLPALRCSFATAFAVAGLDIAGPVFVVEHRRKKKKTKGGARGRPTKEATRRKQREKAEEEPLVVFKVWVLLLTCSTSRAIHFEVVMGIDTEQIIMALERFVARRGIPVVIYSDHGTQLKRASKDLAALWTAATEGIQRYAAREGIQWKFIVESAPWWGGFYERMVGTMKGLLKKVVGNALLTVKEFETTLCKVEATINSRPITYQYDAHNELSPLTPNDLLVGQRAVSFPPFSSDSLPAISTRSEFKERVRYRQLLQQQFESRWRVEYLQELSKQFSKRHEEQVISVGEVVLIEVDNLKRKDWTVGVIKSLSPSADGIVRSVELRTPLGTLNRPVQKLHALELNENNPLSAGGDRVGSEGGASPRGGPDAEDDVSNAAGQPPLEQQQQACALPAPESGSHHEEETPATHEEQTIITPQEEANLVPRIEDQQQGSVNSSGVRRGARRRKTTQRPEYAY